MGGGPQLQLVSPGTAPSLSCGHLLFLTPISSLNLVNIQRATDYQLSEQILWGQDLAPNTFK